MADTALTSMGFAGPATAPSNGGGFGSAVAAPITAVGGLVNASSHLSILGVLAFLVLMWVLVRMAGFRFGVRVSTGVGR